MQCMESNLFPYSVCLYNGSKRGDCCEPGSGVYFDKEWLCGCAYTGGDESQAGLNTPRIEVYSWMEYTREGRVKHQGDMRT